MNSLYKTELKSKKLAALLVLSFIAGMGVMHEFQTREETPPKAFTKMTKIRYQQQINSEEKSASLSRQLKQEELRYGEVVHGTEHVIIYNSIPKCGSRTFKNTSNYLFQNRSNLVPHYSLRITQQTLQHQMEEIKAPALILGQVDFQPFDQEPRPIYINFIRDPVSRMVSSFYFRRFGDHSIGHSNRTFGIYNHLTMEECILGENRCIPKGFIIKIFCGFDDRCSNRSNFTWALERAKSNIDKYYTFIGITEDYEASLRVLEHLMPDMYSGMTETYLSLLNNTSRPSTLSKTKNKEPLSQYLNDTATEHLAADYQLYNYIYGRHRALKTRFRIN